MLAGGNRQPFSPLHTWEFHFSICDRRLWRLAIFIFLGRWSAVLDNWDYAEFTSLGIVWRRRSWRWPYSMNIWIWIILPVTEHAILALRALRTTFTTSRFTWRDAGTSSRLLCSGPPRTCIPPVIRGVGMPLQSCSPAVPHWTRVSLLSSWPHGSAVFT